MSAIQKIEDYKEEHPNYQKEIKKASIAESKKRYEEYLAEQKSLLLKIEESKKAKIECSKLSPRFLLMALLQGVSFIFKTITSYFTHKKEHRSVLGKSSRTELMLAPLPLKTSKVFVRCKKYITNT